MWTGKGGLLISLSLVQAFLLEGISERFVNSWKYISHWNILSIRQLFLLTSTYAVVRFLKKKKCWIWNSTSVYYVVRPVCVTRHDNSCNNTLRTPNDVFSLVDADLHCFHFIHTRERKDSIIVGFLWDLKIKVAMFSKVRVRYYVRYDTFYKTHRTYCRERERRSYRTQRTCQVGYDVLQNPGLPRVFLEMHKQNPSTDTKVVLEMMCSVPKKAIRRGLRMLRNSPEQSADWKTNGYPE